MSRKLQMKTIPAQSAEQTITIQKQVPQAYPEHKGYTDEQLLKTLSAVQEISQSNLENNPIVKRYCQDRGLNLEILKEYGLGCILDTENLIRQLHQRGIDPASLTIVGLLNEQRKCPLINRLVISIRNESGQVVAFSGRALSESVKPKYLHTQSSRVFEKQTILYGLDKCLKSCSDHEIYLVEGFMDVFGARMAGLQNCAAVMGSALTQGQLDLIKSLNCSVTLIFDNDDAGIRGMQKAVSLLERNGIHSSVITLADLDMKMKISNDVPRKDVMDYARLGIRADDLLQIKREGIEFLISSRYFSEYILTTRDLYDKFKAASEDMTLPNAGSIFLECAYQNTHFSEACIKRICNNSQISLKPLENSKPVDLNRFKLNRQKAARWMMDKTVSLTCKECKEILVRLENTVSQSKATSKDGRDLEEDYEK